MKKKLILLAMFVVMLAIGSGFLIKQSITSTKVAEREFCVVKIQGIDYPFELTFRKGTSVSKMLEELHIVEVNKIYEVVSKVQKEISSNDKITHDTTYKVQMK